MDDMLDGTPCDPYSIHRGLLERYFSAAAISERTRSSRLSSRRPRRPSFSVAASQALPINLDDKALLAQLQRDQSPLAGRNDRSGPHTRESDLLAFEITIERSQPGSVKGGCYNKINGDYAGGNKVLLEEVLKGARGLRDVRLGRDPEMGVRAQIFPVRLTNVS
jgi:hypothetical protein